MSGDLPRREDLGIGDLRIVPGFFSGLRPFSAAWRSPSFSPLSVLDLNDHAGLHPLRRCIGQFVEVIHAEPVSWEMGTVVELPNRRDLPGTGGHCQGAAQETSGGRLEDPRPSLLLVAPRENPRGP